jgi:hypothetical protein
VGPGNVWAVGNRLVETAAAFQTLVEHWNGHHWSIVASSNRGQRNTLEAVAAVAGDDIWAAGYRLGTNQHLQTLIEHWNGHVWSIVPSPNPGTDPSFCGDLIDDRLLAIAAPSPGVAWAFGKADCFGALTEVWDGSSWKVRVKDQESSPGSSDLQGGRALSPGDAWAVGQTSDGDTLTRRWSGSRWKTVASPTPPGHAAHLNGVAATSSANAWAVGWNQDPQSKLRDLVLHWDGSAWKVQKTPTPYLGSIGEGLLAVVATSPRNAWAVGNGSTFATGYMWIEHWNGTAWKAQAPPKIH